MVGSTARAHALVSLRKCQDVRLEGCKSADLVCCKVAAARSSMQRRSSMLRHNVRRGLAGPRCSADPAETCGMCSTDKVASGDIGLQARKAKQRPQLAASGTTHPQPRPPSRLAARARHRCTPHPRPASMTSPPPPAGAPDPAVSKWCLLPGTPSTPCCPTAQGCIEPTELWIDVFPSCSALALIRLARLEPQPKHSQPCQNCLLSHPLQILRA